MLMRRTTALRPCWLHGDLSVRLLPAPWSLCPDGAWLPVGSHQMSFISVSAATSPPPAAHPSRTLAWRRPPAAPLLEGAHACPQEGGLGAWDIISHGPAPAPSAGPAGLRHEGPHRGSQGLGTSVADMPTHLSKEARLCRGPVGGLGRAPLCLGLPLSISRMTGSHLGGGGGTLPLQGVQ